MGQFTEKCINYFRPVDNRHDLRFYTLSVLIGMGAAALAILFRELIEVVAIQLFGSYGDDFLESYEFRGYHLVVPILMGAFVAWFTRRFAPESEGHGVPEVIDAVATKRGYMRARMTVVKMISSALSIGAGFSVGREGPTALIGAAFGSLVGQKLKFSVSRMRMVVGCGAAAGIAATFNAPLAGTIFAIELIVGSLNVRSLTPIVLSAMTATVISHQYFGDEHALFSHVVYRLQRPVVEIGFYAVLGLLAGLVGVCYTKLLYWSEDKVTQVPLKPYLKGAIGGLGIALVLLLLPQITGPATWSTMHQTIVPNDLDAGMALFFLFLAFAKIVATSWSLAWGASGGVFAPSLLIGGCLGTAYGYFAHSWFPGISDSPVGYALVGMGAVVAAVTQAPLTAITIIFELTHNLSIILPLIVSSAVGIGVFNHFSEGSIYSLKLIRRGLNLEWGKSVGILSNFSVSKVATTELAALRPDLTVPELISLFESATRSTLPVVDTEGRLLGLVAFWDLNLRLAKDPSIRETATAQDLMITQKIAMVTPDMSLYRAVELVSEGDYSYLPVVSSCQERKLLGRLMRHELLEFYKNQLTNAGIMESPQKETLS